MSPYRTQSSVLGIQHHPGGDTGALLHSVPERLPRCPILAWSCRRQAVKTCGVETDVDETEITVIPPPSPRAPAPLLSHKLPTLFRLP